MKKADVKLHGHYVAKVSGKLTEVYLENESPYGGWIAINMTTWRRVRIRTAARLRHEVLLVG